MKEQIFHKLSEDELMHGMRLCLSNSNNHFKCAEELEKIEQYGIANSHLILSSEEGIKSLLFLAKLLEVDLKSIDISPFFTKHKPKHNAAKEVYWDFKYNEEISNVVLEELKKKIGNYYESINGTYVLAEEQLKKDYVREMTMKQRQFKVEQWRNSWDKEGAELQWWNQADYYKNRGFYVNYYNQKWESPSDITKEIYLTSKKVVSTIINYLNTNCNRTDFNEVKEYINLQNMNIIELFNSAPNGLKLDHIILSEISNADGSGIDYKIEYVDFVDNSKVLVGTCDLIMGNIQFEESKAIGIPFGAIKLLTEWIEKNLEKD